MKSPLSHQATEYDCGPTTLINAIRFLFERDEIPPDVIKHIVLYSLDAYNSKGEFGKNGTSAMAMMFLSNWLNRFGKTRKFPIHCEYITAEEVYIGQNSRIVSGLQQGGVAVVRLYYGCSHYVLLTGVGDQTVDLFDPYFRKRPFKISGVEIVNGDPARGNRRIAFPVLNEEKNALYAMGPVKTREAVLIFNEGTRKTPSKTIEYFI